MKKKPKELAEYSTVITSLKYWRKVRASDKAFVSALTRCGAQRYSDPAELVFNDKDILLLENNGKGIFVWKSIPGAKCDFNCTIFFSRSERPRAHLLKNAIAAVRMIHPESNLDIKFGSELIEIATDKLLIESGFFRR